MARVRDQVERAMRAAKIVLLFEERYFDNKRSFRNDPSLATAHTFADSARR
jgi:hypothetical protein